LNEQVITIRTAPNHLDRLPSGQHSNFWVNFTGAGAIFSIDIHID
jgi:hypothetical protein